MKKRALILLFIFSLGFSLPFYNADGAGAIAYISKEFGLDLVARAIAQSLLKKLGNGVVNSINSLGIDKSGVKGKPVFVQNWKELLADAQVVGENQFRSQLNYVVKKGILCEDMQDSLVKTFQGSKVPYIDIGEKGKYDELKQDTIIPYQTKIKCTVPNKVRKEFKKDFEKGGGWKTWSKMVEPQNNFAGALALSLEELGKQRSSQKEANKNESIAGGGFNGVRGACQKATSQNVADTVCFKNCFTEKSGKTYETCLKECTGATALGKDNQCAFLGKTLTPGKILGEGAAGWLDGHQKWLVSSDELSEVLISVVTAAVNKLADFGINTKSDSKGKTTTDDTFEEEKQTCTDEYCDGKSDDAESDRNDLKTIKDNTGKLQSPSGCYETSGDSTIDEQDCGDPSNASCSLCK